MAITNTAMLAKLKISAFGIKRKDMDVSRETHKLYGTSILAGHFQKSKLNKKYVGKISSVSSSARHFHREMTLPWEEDRHGARILPASNYLPYTKEMRDFKTQFNNAVDEFALVYPSAILDAQQFLKTMYNPDDYPPPAEIKKYFGFETDIKPIPDANDFRVQMDADEVRRIKEDIQKQTNERMEMAMKDVWDRVFNLVSHSADRLGDRNGKVYDSYLENIRELLAILPALNITNDPNLIKSATEIERRILVHTPGELRRSKSLKKEVADAASNIAKDMSGYMGSTK